MNSTKQHADSGAQPTDEALIRAVARDDTAAVDAFRQLHDRYARLVYSFCASHVGATEAEDISQDVWRRLWTGLKESRYDATQFRALLRRVAKNRIIDIWRRKHLEFEHSEAIDQFADNQSTGPGAGLLHAERMDRLKECLEKLRAAHQQRAEVAAAKLKLDPVTEICERLGINRNRVDKLWFGARQALQNCVQRSEDAS